MKKFISLIIIALCSIILTVAAQVKKDDSNVIKTSADEKAALRDLLRESQVLQIQVRANQIAIENAVLKMKMAHDCKDCSVTEDFELLKPTKEDKPKSN